VTFHRLFPDAGFKIITEPSSPEDYHALKEIRSHTDVLIVAYFPVIATIIGDYLSGAGDGGRTPPEKPF